ncbi:hypothetical protein EfsSVR2330_08860 [Enterococcus faecalis]|uniref:hypothetical protein n=1 Tax=Enterococcus faecalis TaxID=1351 RepID=UPI002303108A|nr:hypothetical protein [Enterococcus faecalis]BDQ53375.1 hypothetical protein EfsSVR2330_08860 [Enterococcus faecalis]
MTLKELKQLLDQMELPISYREWQPGQVPELPYLLYYENTSNNFFADNEVYCKQTEIVIELYTNTKNIREENKLEELLNTAKIPFDTYETYLSSEQMYLKAYEITI